MNININSNNGWQKASFTKKSTLSNFQEDLALFTIKISSQFWDKKKMLTEDDYDLVINKDICFKEILIDLKRWNVLINRISNWSEKGEMFSEILYEENGERLFCELTDKSENLIVSITKPLFKIIIEDSKSKCEFNMIVDRTSFNILLP